MQEPAKFTLVGALLLALNSLACLSTADVVGAIAEPIPMGTPGVPGLDTQAWQSGPPVPIGTSQEFGDVTLVVKNVIRPANHVADDATFYARPGSGQEYVAVDISATCNLPAGEACYLSAADFSASGAQGATYFAQLTTSGGGHSFEGGELKGGKSRSGYLFFLVSRDDSGLVMQYPSSILGSIGAKAQFVIEE
jgi:hypothetical protein